MPPVLMGGHLSAARAARRPAALRIDSPLAARIRPPADRAARPARSLQ